MTSRVRTFCITVNNWDESDLTALIGMEIITYGIFGEEVGEAGTPHLQGYVQLGKPQTVSAFQKKLKKAGVKCALLIAKGDLASNIEYCSKDASTEEGSLHIWGSPKSSGTRSDLAQIRDMIESGCNRDDIIEKFPGDWFRYRKNIVEQMKYRQQKLRDAAYKEEMETTVLRTWQKDAVVTLLAQNDREVLWIVDYKGDTGKSYLSRWLHAMKGAFEVTSGKTADIAYAYNYEPIVVFDFSRQKQEFVNYSAIEDFKNGRIFSPKYESKTLRFKSAKVIVFSNWDPDETTLSEDRWNIIRMGDKPDVAVIPSGFVFRP